MRLGILLITVFIGLFSLAYPTFADQLNIDARDEQTLQYIPFNITIYDGLNLTKSVCIDNQHDLGWQLNVTRKEALYDNFHGLADGNQGIDLTKWSNNTALSISNQYIKLTCAGTCSLWTDKTFNNYTRFWSTDAGANAGTFKIGNTLISNANYRNEIGSNGFTEIDINGSGVALFYFNGVFKKAVDVSAETNKILNFTTGGGSEWQVDDVYIDSGNQTFGSQDIFIQNCNSTYHPRYYYVTTSIGGNIDNNAFLLKEANGVAVTFVVKYKFAALEGVLMTASNPFINGSQIVVEQDETDASGQAYAFLDPNVQYEVILSKEGYGTKILNVQSGVSQTYEVSISANEVINLNQAFADVYYRFDPLFSSVQHYEGKNTTVNLTVVAPNANLNSFWINISLVKNDTNITSLYNGSLSTSGGGKIVGILNLSNATDLDQLRVDAYIDKSGAGLFSTSRTYTVFVSTPANTSIFTILENLRGSSGLSNFATNLIALFIAMLFAGFMAVKGAGTYGVGFGVLGVLAVFVFLGWFDWLLYTVLILVTGGIYFLNRGGA